MRTGSLAFSFPNGEFQGEVALQPGELNLLVGANGAGKTTLLRALRKRQNILFTNTATSFCHQQALLPVGDISGENFVKALKGLVNRKWRFEEKAFKEFSSSLGIASILSKPVKQLSGGENQSLKVFLCLAEDCDLYILDEPFNSLDLSRVEILWEEIEKLRQQGKTFFMTDHQLHRYKKKKITYHCLKKDNDKIELLQKLSWSDAIKVVEQE